MKIAKIQVGGTSAKVIWQNPITAGIVGATIDVEYTDPLWEELDKTVVFTGNVTKDVLSNDSEIPIPTEAVADAGKKLLVGFYGAGKDGFIAIPTLRVSLGQIMPAADPSGDSTTYPTLPVWAQLQQKIEQMNQDGCGATFIPAVSEDGTLYWTNDKGLTNPQPVNIRGPQGEQGPIGRTPKKGVDYFTAEDQDEILAQLTGSLFDYTPIMVSFEQKGALAQYQGIGNPVRIKETEGGFSYAVLPVIQGETYRIDGVHYWESACYLLTDASGKVTRYDGAADTDGVTIIQHEFTVKAAEAFLYINSMGPFVSLEKKSVRLGGYQGPLTGKKIVYDGDSICAPWYGDEGNGGAYPKLLGDYTGVSYDNQAVGGGRITTCPAGESFHSIVDNLSNLPSDADLYCFEGGINDYSAAVNLGNIDYENFSDALDKTTLCGALETIFRHCLNQFPGKPVCLIITHKCQNSAYKANSAGNTFAQFREKMIAVCQKYSIPYYDAFAESGLNGWNEVQKARYFINADGTHPNVSGYKRYYLPQLLQLFERLMPLGIENEVEDDMCGEVYTNVLDTVGYTENVRISSNGELKPYDGRDATGKIPVSYGDVVYLKNVTIPNYSTDYENKIAYWNADGSLLTQYDLTTASEPTAVYNSEGNLVQFVVGVNCSYIQLGAINIDGSSIITVNQPIK